MQKPKINHYEKVANMLGIGIYETFKIDGDRNYYRLSKRGIEQKEKLDYSWSYFPSLSYKVLDDLLSGQKCAVKLPPYVPKNGDTYYIPTVSGKLGYNEYMWFDDETDKLALENGLVFATADEAMNVSIKMLEVTKRR